MAAAERGKSCYGSCGRAIDVVGDDDALFGLCVGELGGEYVAHGRGGVGSVFEEAGYQGES